jgi:hypothetical protein
MSDEFLRSGNFFNEPDNPAQPEINDKPDRTNKEYKYL